jgi:membrane associated rhomboid family serine protease
MLRIPNPIHLPHYPVTGATLLLAIVLTISWWSGTDLTYLLQDPSIAHGQIWRLLTCTLFHSNIVHLVFNLYWIWVLGTLIEDRFGSLPTLALFIYFAIGSSAAEFALLNGCVGLSGIVYGICGFVWMMSGKDERLADALDVRTIALLVSCFLIGVILSLIGVMPVANIAHPAGAMLGALLGWTLTRSWRHPAMLATPPIAALIILIALATMVRPQINRSQHAGEEEAYRGYQALADGRDQEAVTWLRDATSASPASATSWFNLGIAEQRQGNYLSAARAYERATQLDPANANFRKARSEIGNYLAALTSAKRPS